MLAPLTDARPDGIVFLGTPATAARCLALILESGVDVDLVVTAEPKRRGRGASLMKTPVHELADAEGIPVVHDLDAMISRIESRGGVWLGVVVAYGRLIPQQVLTRVPLVNLHFSLLPRWRGAAPVERAILAGDDHVGVCVMRVVEALDAGEVYARVAIPVGPNDDVEELRDRLCVLGTAELVRLLGSGWGTPEPQVGEPSYARKIAKEDRRLSFAESAEHLARTVRIGDAYGEFAGQRVKVSKVHVIDIAESLERWPLGEVRLVGRRVVVACGDGHLVLERVQPAGKSVMSAGDWWNGVASTLGTARFDR
jgi:methionyl-tRNA formyltransferase